ncbi:hypothetical protein FZW96_11990 [Bacillus sp. BGMRC 2118]|nr:hypothetical protein FZW96_11990 [Bacillus sp. BGMRC 2118]
MLSLVFEYGAVVLTSSIVTLIINTLLKEGIVNIYRKSLEDYKSKLAEIAEARRLNFERKVFDFSQYSLKRHEIYPEIYKNLIKTTSSASYFINILDTASQFSKLEAPQEEYIVDLTNKTLKEVDENFDLFMYSELFLSENVANLGKEIVKTVTDIVRSLSMSVSLGSVNIKQELDSSGDNMKRELRFVSEKLSNLKKLMREELSVGDYEDNIEMAGERQNNGSK